MTTGPNVTDYPGIDGTPTRPRFSVYQRAKDYGVYNQQGALIATFPFSVVEMKTQRYRANVIAELLHHSGVCA